MIYELPANEYWQEFNRHPNIDGFQLPAWTGSRAFTVGQTIYINKDAWYFDATDKDLLIKHEIGHTQGKKHTLIGVMSPFGIIRYLTASIQGVIVLFVLAALWLLYRGKKRSTV